MIDLEKRFGPLPQPVIDDADLAGKFAQNEETLQEVEHDLAAALQQLDLLSSTWQMAEAASTYQNSKQ